MFRKIGICLNEDKRLEPYKVWFTPTVRHTIDVIKAYNSNNIEGIKEFEEYLQGLKSYISKPVLAWDNIDKYPHTRNGATHVHELGYNFIYYVNNSKFDHKQYVCVVKIYFNLSEFGLQDPFATNGNQQRPLVGNQQGQVKENILNKNTNRVRRTIHLKESELKRMIDETVRSVLAERRYRRLNEAYLGDLYHFTTLSHLYGILKANRIYRTVDDFGHTDSRMGDDVDVVCCTRDKNFDRGKSVHSVRITLDGELMSSSLRNAKIHPYNYYEEGEYPKKSGESEERVYNSDIYPLNKYCKSIDIFLGDINKCDYGYCDDIDNAYEGLAKMGNNDPSDRDINLWFINHIKEDFPIFSNKIQIHGYNPINENIRLNEAVGRSFYRVLREHLTRNR